jgi:hypothetical protein
MLAQGISGKITGARADAIICDDVEVAGNCDTPGKREALRERLAELEFILTPGGTILFVGTPHCEESLYRDPKHEDAFLRSYRRLTLPIMNAAGASAWPERFPKEAIAALRQRVGALHFERQMMLKALPAEAARLDPAALIRYAGEPEYREAGGRAELSLLGRRLVSGGGYWDPAYGRPGSGDSSVLAACYADQEGNHFLHRLRYLTHDPDAAEDPATQQCRQVAHIARDLLLPVIRVETNGIGRFLPALLRRELAKAGAACAVVEQNNHRAKADRILGALEPALAARRLHMKLYFVPVSPPKWRNGCLGSAAHAMTLWMRWPVAYWQNQCAWRVPARHRRRPIGVETKSQSPSGFPRHAARGPHR